MTWSQGQGQRLQRAQLLGHPGRGLQQPRPQLRLLQPRPALEGRGQRRLADPAAGASASPARSATATGSPYTADRRHATSTTTATRHRPADGQRRALRPQQLPPAGLLQPRPAAVEGIQDLGRATSRSSPSASTARTRRTSVSAAQPDLRREASRMLAEQSGRGTQVRPRRTSPARRGRSSSASGTTSKEDRPDASRGSASSPSFGHSFEASEYNHQCELRRYGGRHPHHP